MLKKNNKIDAYRQEHVTCPHCEYSDYDDTTNCESSINDGYRLKIKCARCEKEFFLKTKRETYFSSAIKEEDL